MYIHVTDLDKVIVLKHMHLNLPVVNEYPCAHMVCQKAG